VGYTIAGVGALPLLGFVTFLFSFVPAIGAAGVCALTGAYIWIAGETGLGIFLVVYGLVAVGLTDEVVKPLLARGDGQLPASIIFFAMLCGLAGFGVMGLVAGPLIVVLFKVVVETVRPSQIPGSADGTL
jgi:predicted PurR-regulated permease PerM